MFQWQSHAQNGFDWKEHGYRGISDKDMTYVIRKSIDQPVVEEIYMNTEDPYQQRPLRGEDNRSMRAQLRSRLAARLSPIGDPFVNWL